MKFIHIADVHLGAIPDSNMPWAKERQKEIWEGFKNIITVCNEEKTDLLLIAGDLFHKQPLIRELKEVNYLLSTLKTAKVVMMAGNHDYIGIRSNYRGFEWDERVHMFLEDTMEAVELPEMNTFVYGLSYLTRDITEPRYDKIDVSRENGIQILLAHGGDEKNIPINRNKLLNSGFDYIALGHIHKPEIISNRMAYAGSLEPLDRNETGQRGYIIGEIRTDGKRQTDIRFIKSSHREYKKLTVTVNQDTTNGALVDQIKDMIRKEGDNHIYQINIEGFRDEDIRFDKTAIYPLGNILEVTDESVPDYDFDTLFRENSDNIIGLFIKRIRDAEKQDTISRKALYYGTQALLESVQRDSHRTI